MWTRRDVKERGKLNFKKNYWKSVFAAFLYSLFFVSTSASVSSKRDEFNFNIEELEEPAAIGLLILILAIVSTILIVMGIIKLLILNPLEVGCQRFFTVNQDVTASLSELGHGFRNNYVSCVLGNLIKSILISIGYFLFIIPGVILSYSYVLVPFILADEPNISATQAVKKSRLMMQGHKWAYFVYNLSFIGWMFLSVITCGIVGFFYVNPYKRNADAALYLAIKSSSNV